MRHSISAVFESGVFRPLEPVDLAEGTRAEVIPVRDSASANAADGSSTWPSDYFPKTAGALAGGVIEHPPQGDIQEQSRIDAAVAMLKQQLWARLSRMKERWPQPKAQARISAAESLVKAFCSGEQPTTEEEFKRFYYRQQDNVGYLETIEAGIERMRVLY